MSEAVTINYQQIAIRCHSICEIAETQIREMDEMLADLEGGASRFLNQDTDNLIAEIKSKRQLLLSQMKKVRQKADEEAKLGVVKTDNHDSRVQHMHDTENEAKRLQQQVDTLAVQELARMRALLDSLLSESISSGQQRLMDRANGIVSLDSATKKLLDSIEDEILRQFVYIAFVRDSSLSGDALIDMGKNLMSESVEARYEKEAELIRAELDAARVPKETVDQIVSGGKSIGEIREAATTEIVGEKVRQKSMKIIMNAIRERGFIVEKKNIKINRETNEVTMVALKASGEKVTFRIFLDGKFIYDFRGYEGQACQKDIEPFVQALEEVYGMHITGKQEIWSNPDKISTMKYQAINTNKNKR